jgi:hypothetical protein
MVLPVWGLGFKLEGASHGAAQHRVLLSELSLSCSWGPSSTPAKDTQEKGYVPKGVRGSGGKPEWL